MAPKLLHHEHFLAWPALQDSANAQLSPPDQAEGVTPPPVFSLRPSVGLSPAGLPSLPPSPPQPSSLSRSPLPPPTHLSWSPSPTCSSRPPPTSLPPPLFRRRGLLRLSPSTQARLPLSVDMGSPAPICRRGLFLHSLHRRLSPTLSLSTWPHPPPVIVRPSTISLAVAADARPSLVAAADARPSLSPPPTLVPLSRALRRDGIVRRPLTRVRSPFPPMWACFLPVVGISSARRGLLRPSWAPPPTASPRARLPSSSPWVCRRGLRGHSRRRELLHHSLRHGLVRRPLTRKPLPPLTPTSPLPPSCPSRCRPRVRSRRRPLRSSLSPSTPPILVSPAVAVADTRLSRRLLRRRGLVVRRIRRRGLVLRPLSALSTWPHPPLVAVSPSTISLSVAVTIDARLSPVAAADARLSFVAVTVDAVSLAVADARARLAHRRRTLCRWNGTLYPRRHRLPWRRRCRHYTTPFPPCLRSLTSCRPTSRTLKHLKIDRPMPVTTCRDMGPIVTSNFGCYAQCSI